MAAKTQVTKKNSYKSVPVKKTAARKGKSAAPATPMSKVRAVKPVIKAPVPTVAAPVQPASAKHQDRLIYIRQGKRERTQPVGCMAYRISHDESGTTIYYGLSTHHPQDQFDRSIARKVAEGRRQAALGTSSADDLLTPFIKESHTSVFTQHFKNLSKDSKDNSMVVSGKYVSEEINPIRALHDLLESFRYEERIPSRIRRCMKNMALRFWATSYTQDKKFQEKVVKDLKKTAN